MPFKKFTAFLSIIGHDDVRGRNSGYIVIVPNRLIAHTDVMLTLSETKSIGIIIFSGCNIIDATGPAGVFGAANELAKDRGVNVQPYRIQFIGSTVGPIATSAGPSLYASKSLDPAPETIDTLICAGGVGSRSMSFDQHAVRAVAYIAFNARRIVSVCTGAFVLAASGVLDGKRAVTHWAHCDTLAKRFPDVIVEPDPIFIRDENIYTSAGITAGMDLTLALIEEDLGRAFATDVAKEMVMFLKRPGSQAQFSEHLRVQMAPDGKLKKVQQWVLDNLAKDHTVESLAERATMSPRTFYRHFKNTIGITPSKFVVDVRVDAAKRLLEESPLQVKAIAVECGFGDEERMRRTFHRRLGISPDHYRQRFSSTF